MKLLRAHAAGAIWLGWTLCLSGAFARLAAHNLANYRPVSNDEVELMAVGYKLATRGVLGSDMYAGFFGGDAHHFETLPLQHVLEALSFSVFGAGVAQARWVSLVAALVIVWLVGWLAYRWYGLGTALLAEFLLVVWQSNLTAASDGLPLLGVARTARYDVLAVAFAWLAIGLLYAALRRSSRALAFAVGMSAGLATLAQFFGAFVVPLVGASWLLLRRRQWRSDSTIVWIVLGTVVVLLPWALFAALNFSDLQGQLTVFGNRGDFLNPAFYATNVLGEPSRYNRLLASPFVDPSVAAPRSPWLLALGGLPACVYVGWRSRRTDAPGDRLLLASLVTFCVLLLLLDQTKVALYAIVLLPSLCLALAAAWSGLLGWIWRSPSRPWLRLVAAAASLCVLVVIGQEGVRAYQVDFAEAAQVTPYLGLGQQIEAALPPDARIMGPERWWWALHDHPYLSLRSIWWQWGIAASSAQQPPPRFLDWVARSQTDVVIVNINVRGDVESFPEALQAQFWEFIDGCTTLVTIIPNPNYFDTEIYAVDRGPSACLSA